MLPYCTIPHERFVGEVAGHLGVLFRPTQVQVFMPAHKTVDYSKWDNLDDSDDEEQPGTNAVAENTAAAIAIAKQKEEEKQQQEAEKASLRAAIDAAVRPGPAAHA